MPEPVERLLKQMRPRGAPEPLRAQVEAAVGRALGANASRARRTSRKRSWLACWDNRCLVTAASTLLFAIALNWYVQDASDRRMLERMGAGSLVTTDSEGPRAAGGRPMTWEDYAARQQQILREVLAWEQGICYETPCQGSEVERHRLFRPYRGSSLDQRDLGVACVRAA